MYAQEIKVDEARVCLLIHPAVTLIGTHKATPLHTFTAARKM
jgi:hypothetical protein